MYQENNQLDKNKNKQTITTAMASTVSGKITF